MTEWIISANPNNYKVADAFSELKKIEWQQSTNIQAGDIVYIYVSNPVKAIQFKCKVNKVDVKTRTIDDNKFYVNADFSTTKKRFMEIELIEKYSTPLFNSNNMNIYGFRAPQGPIRATPETSQYLSLVENLINSKELVPDSHDGSYKLVREAINAYKNMNNLNSCDYRDLNLIYHMSIGTWSQGVDSKQKSIIKSNLPAEEKERLKKLIQETWERARNFEYTNQENNAVNFGMFGTGFFSFNNNNNDDSPYRFIKMCLDISDLDNDEDIFKICEKTLNRGINGMQAASASIILHCLKPFTFPILNNNQGAMNIFDYFKVPINNPSALDTYIDNCRIIKSFRDKNFYIKNYRIFDKAALNINQTNINYMAVLDYLQNNSGLTYSNPKKSGLSIEEKKNLKDLKENGKFAVTQIKKMVKVCKKEFKLNFSEQIRWLDGSNTRVRDYLWAQLKYKNHKTNPISISIFAELPKKADKPRYRFSLELNNDQATEKDREKYKTHLNLPLATESKLVYVTTIKEDERPIVIDEPFEAIKEKTLNNEYDKVQVSRIIEMDDSLSNNDYEKIMIESIKALIPYYEHVIGVNKITINDDEDKVEEIKESKYDKNLILYGPPGTGKTYYSAIYAVAICDGKTVDELNDYEYVRSRYKELEENGRIAFTTFHQSYSYEEFIEGIKPNLDNESKEVTYNIEAGVFKRFCDNSEESNPDLSQTKIQKSLKPHVFIIDEINRGNISKIFGELITLIETTKREGMLEATSAILPYSKTSFSVPKNVYIIGTMNTADRSIALIDTALRRRFKFVEMMPNVQVLRDNNANKVEDLEIDTMLEKINERITFLYDREHTIGHSFFMGLQGEEATIEKLKTIFQESIIPLLQEYFYEDYQKIQLVLGDNEKTSEKFKFILDQKVVANKIFKGNVEDVIDLPETTYEINKEAFSKLESYKEIFTVPIKDD